MSAPGFAISPGDIFRWLKLGVKATLDFVKDEITDTWQMIVTIAGTMYRAILDTVDAVVGAAIWVFNAIKTGVEELIRYTQFLFDWDDIRRTKDVMHSIVRKFLKHTVDDLENTRSTFDRQIDALEDTIDKWAGIKDWSSLGGVADKPPAASGSGPPSGQSSGSQHLMNHFRDNSGSLEIVDEEPTVNTAQNLIDGLLDAVSQEGNVLTDVYNNLQALARDFAQLTVTDIIKRVAGILADGLLGSVRVVVDALFNVLIAVAKDAIKILDTNIHIPVISDILNALGIPDITFMDLFTWIAAVVYTVPYKIASNKAPFPNNSETNAIISVSSWKDMLALFHGNAGARSSSAPGLSAAAATVDVGTQDIITMSKDAREAVHVTCHMFAGFFRLMSGLLGTLEAADSKDGKYARQSAVVSICAGGCTSAGNALVSQYPIANATVSAIANATSVLMTISKIVFSGPVQKILDPKFDSITKNSMYKDLLPKDDERAMGALVDVFLICPALFASCWHLYELSGQPEGGDRTGAILCEASYLTTDIARVCYAVAVNSLPGSPVKLTFAGIMLIANTATAGLQIAQAKNYGPWVE